MMTGMGIAFRRGILAGALTAFALAPAGADETWLTPLRLQVKTEQSCDLAAVVSQREFKVGDEVKIEGRLRCADGREYDFSRERPHLKFQVRLCQPSYC